MVTNGARYACEFRSRGRAFAPDPFAFWWVAQGTERGRPTEAPLLRMNDLLSLEATSSGNGIVALPDNVILDDVYRCPCGQAAHDDKRSEQGGKIAL
jgi:hypothetical protein